MANDAMTLARDDDGEVARRCAAGDRLAQEQVFRQLRTRVHRTLFRIMGSNRYLEDLLQDTFIEIFGSIRSFGGRSSLATWADTIAARVAFRHLSQRKRWPLHLQAIEDVSAEERDPESQRLAKEAMRRLYAILDRIEPQYRIAYTLHVLDDRPMKEVAAIAGCSTIAVKNRIWRARGMVRSRALREPLLAKYIREDERP